MESYTGIILAGGKSSRMGTDKGLLVYKGKKLIKYAIAVLSKLVDEIIIIVNNDAYNEFGYKVFHDNVKEVGPIGGILTGLENTTTEKNIVLSCDMPFLNIGLLQYLIENSEGFDITVPIHNNQTEQLVGIYSKACMETYRKQIANNNLALHKANDLMKINKLNITDEMNFWSEQLFDNFNTPDALLN